MKVVLIHLNHVVLKKSGKDPIKSRQIKYKCVVTLCRFSLGPNKYISNYVWLTENIFILDICLARRKPFDHHQQCYLCLTNKLTLLARNVLQS